MKKIFYVSVILMFSFSILNASNIEKVNDKHDGHEVIKIEKIESVTKDGVVIFTRYTGVCRDGHRFNFSAPDRETAQEFVNSYCELRRDYQIKDKE